MEIETVSGVNLSIQKIWNECLTIISCIELQFICNINAEAHLAYMLIIFMFILALNFID